MTASQISLKNLVETLEYESPKALTPHEIFAAYEDYIGNKFKKDFPKPAKGTSIFDYFKNLIIEHDLPVRITDDEKFTYFKRNSRKAMKLEVEDIHVKEQKHEPKKIEKENLESIPEDAVTEETKPKVKSRISSLRADIKSESTTQKTSTLRYSPPEKKNMKLPMPEGYVPKDLEKKDLDDYPTNPRKTLNPNAIAFNPLSGSLFNQAISNVKKDFNKKELPKNLISFYTSLIEKCGVLDCGRLDQIASKFGREKPLNFEKFGFSSKKDLLLSIPGFYQPKTQNTSLIFYRPPSKQSGKNGNTGLAPSTIDNVHSLLFNISSSLTELVELAGKGFSEELLQFYQNDYLSNLASDSEKFDENNNPINVNKIKFKNFKNDLQNKLCLKKLTRHDCLINYPNFHALEQLATLVIQESENNYVDINLINRLISAKKLEICKSQNVTTMEGASSVGDRQDKDKKNFNLMGEVMSACGTDKLEDILRCMEGLAIDGRRVVLKV